jgi:hypothetical protein
MIQKTLSKILFLLIILSSVSCKKDSSSDGLSSGKSYTVKYEISLSSPVVANQSMGVAYTNATGNTEMDYSVSGTNWSKTITMQNSANTPLVGLGGIFILSQSGSGEAKIFINGVLKSEVTATTLPSTDNTYGLVLSAHYQL